MTRFLVILALLAQVSTPPKVYPGCVVQQMRTGSDAIVKHGFASKWFCTTNTSPASYIVSKQWFKENCRAFSDNTANCREFAPVDSRLVIKDAAGPSMWKHRLEDVALGAVAVAIVAACIASGGGCAGAFGG